MIRTIQPGYITTQVFSTSMPTQGLKPNFTTIYILIPNDGDDPTWLYINTGFHGASMSHKGTSLAIQQAIYRSQMIRTIQPGYITTQVFSASMPDKDIGLAYTTNYISIPND